MALPLGPRLYILAKWATQRIASRFVRYLSNPFRVRNPTYKLYTAVRPLGWVMPRIESPG